jgi:cysteine synthase
MVAAMKGYKVKVIMPESTSREKIKMVKTFGGEVILMENLRYRKFAINDVKDMAKQGERMVFLNQYENENNPYAHYTGTAEEILNQMEGKKIDYSLPHGHGRNHTVSVLTERKVSAD